MKTLLFIATIILSVFLFLRNSFALEIPLSGGSGGGEGTAKIGYVDMERIFQVYPQTKAAKDDYRKRLEKLKSDLAQKEAELGGIRDRIAVLDSTVKANTPPVVDGSTESLAAPEPGNLNTMRTDLETKQAEYEEARARALEDLATFENRQSQMILGKIYEALVSLAEEEQVTLVVDKSSILYGSASTDLTDKLQARIRGF